MEACCTCARLLSVAPLYSEKSEKCIPQDRRLDCCGRTICGDCLLVRLPLQRPLPAPTTSNRYIYRITAASKPTAPTARPPRLRPFSRRGSKNRPPTPPSRQTHPRPCSRHPTTRRRTPLCRHPTPAAHPCLTPPRNSPSTSSSRPNRSSTSSTMPSTPSRRSPCGTRCRHRRSAPSTA